MGPLLTERALIAAEVHPEQYKDFIDMAETPQFTGHILHAIATDPKAQEISGHTLVCLLYTSPSPRDKRQSRMPSSA